jgi:hypothetical protein
MITPNNGNGATAYLYNKVTGEVRRYRTDKDYYIMPSLKKD